MSETISVNISATAFSLLLYENSRKDFDQEGFLLGNLVRREKRTITDNDQEVVNIEIIININSVIPCPQVGYINNDNGSIDVDKLSTFLDDQSQHVVAWYKYKQIPSFNLTLREKIVLKRLASHFSPETPEYFLMCLATSQTGSESGGATHLFSQTFIRYNSNFQAVPMHIVNLKDSYDIYKGPESCSESFKKLLSPLKINTKKSQGYDIVTKIESALEVHMNQLVAELAQAENTMYDLELEVAELNEKAVLREACSEEEDPLNVFENGLLDIIPETPSPGTSSEVNVNQEPEVNKKHEPGVNNNNKKATKVSGVCTERVTRSNSSVQLEGGDTKVMCYAQAAKKNKS